MRRYKHTVWFILFCVGCVLLYQYGWLPFGGPPLRLAHIERTPLSSGVELVRADLVRGARSVGEFVAVYSDPAHIHAELHLNPDKDPLASMLGPDTMAVLNAGFFTPERRPTGLLVSHGRVLSPFVPEAGGAGSGVLILEEGRVQLLERDGVGTRDFARTTLAIQAGPRVIESTGQMGILSDDGQRAHRTVAGVDDRGRLALAVVLGSRGPSSGPTLFELQSLLSNQSLGPLAFRFALNLDGGPSTGLHLKSASVRINRPESSPVHSVLTLRPKP